MQLHARFCLAIFMITTAATLHAQSPAPAYRNPALPIEERVRDLLGRMTVEEKARQLDMYRGLSPSVGDDAQKINDELKAHGFSRATAEAALGSLGAGSIHDLYGSPELTNAIQKWVVEHNRLGIPVLFAEEGLHGFNDGTLFPAPINLASTWDRELARSTGAVIGAEARSTGVGMLFAPVLDLAREPRWGRVEEDFGEDPFLTGQLGLAYVRGMQGSSLATDHTCIAEPKHFAGHGSPESGTNTSPAHYGERELRSVMLKAFEPAMREGHAWATMAAYHEIDGIPVTADAHLLNTILRGEWGFEGFVLSDLGAIERLYGAHRVAATPKDAVLRALNAGVDMQFYDFDHATFQGAIAAGIKDGSLEPAALDRAVSDVLRVKFALGLFDQPYIDPALNGRVHRAQAHLDLSLRSALESMTLLRNEGHLLPLSKSLKRIAVIGPSARIARYGDYSQGSAASKDNDLYSELTRLMPQTEFPFADGADLAAAVKIAGSAEVAILALGEDPNTSGEGVDRSSLDLPSNQQALLEAVAATGKPVVLVLQNGRPLTLPWAAAHIPAILEAWYPGEFGGRAIALTLAGNNNPGGHLTVSFPRSTGTLPDFYNYHPSKNHRYADGSDRPVFPFGFGLSYASFRFNDLRVETPRPGADKIVATVNVTNTSTLAGDTVAQLYLREDVSSVATPERALKGFERVHLEPGQSRPVRFEVPLGDVALWSAEGRWTVEPGAYTAWAGDSSQAALEAHFKLEVSTH